MVGKWRGICSKLSYDRDSKEKWKGSHQFVFTCIAAAYSFTTVVEFARLVFTWSGLFLFQYLILLLTVGFPMIYVESILGQFSNCSPVYVYNICPAAVGLGIGSVIYAFITSLYHYVFLLYSISYAFFSCFAELPWTACIAWWRPTENCYVFEKKLVLPFCSKMGKLNFTVGIDCREWTPSAEEFWRQYVSGGDRSEPLSFTNIKWSFAALIILFWILTYIVSSKGIAAIAKISWLLVLCTSTLLLILSIFSLTLDGAARGIAQGFTPKFPSIIKMNSWKEAAIQIIGTFNINYGIMATYSSFNNFNHKLYRDLVILCLIMVVTALCSCIFVFSVVGNLAFKLHKTMDELMPHDTWTLCFVLVPQALSNVVWPQVWSFLFFMFLSLLPFAFHFAVIQVVLTSIFDGVPVLKTVRKWVCFVYCFIATAVGLTYSTHNGKKIYEFMKIYCLPSIPFSFLFAVGKIIIVSWIYGWENFLHDVEFMLGKRHSWLLTVCLSFVDPFTILFLFIHCSCDFFLDASTTTSKYPAWVQFIGWFLILMPVLPTLIGFVCDARKHRKYKARH
uniref:Transporter n=1 Tax=Strigamia maritima TaxID=126957 RepID=T1IXK0_STRMM